MSDDRPERGSKRQLRVRRAPKLSSFLITGAAIGVVVAVIGGLAGPDDSTVGRGPLIGYLAILLGLIGGVVGGAVAVVLDRVRR